MSNNFTLKDFKRAVKKLEEVLNLKKTEIIRDPAIKRFELCFDLAWKTIKNYAKEQGVECYSPKECFKTAFQLKLINHEEKWLEIIDNRNLSTHLYSEKQAEEIYSKLSDYLKLFKELFKSIKD
jgi:nucleotidyltransferase substrate binding protein (TIGR01987 family)